MHAGVCSLLHSDRELRGRSLTLAYLCYSDTHSSAVIGDLAASHMVPSDGTAEASIGINNNVISPTSRRWVQVIRFACEEWRCLLLTLLILLCLISLVWCFNLLRMSSRDVCQPVHYSLAAMMLLLLYLIYLFECFNCRTRLELATAIEVTQIAARIAVAVKHDPKLWWFCFSYHFVRRRSRRCHCRPRYTEVRFTAGTETSLHRGETAALSTEAHDRVITFAKQHFITETTTFKCVWCDKSPRISWDEWWDAAVHLTFVKEFIFANEATRQQYEGHKKSFMKLQQSNDDFIEIREGFQLHNEAEIQPSILVVKHKSALFHQRTFLLATIFLLSWPYRILIYARTSELDFPFRKILRIIPKNSHHCGYKYLPRSSSSVEWCNNEACVIENPLANRNSSQHSSGSDDDLLSIDIRYTGSD
ncbi:putative transmembrane protein [Echinococcus granulosus]|uniref:Transmembrane protein 151B n=1 Tax=Echinococcus granulosus TaxID=6210 RepID=A0A068WK18_ECHGR|nr:putative transmembrane protein [Echinococcus granulosus]CDS20123.1 transmembrane protein 151B [Echinococcus granulosus]